MGKQLGKFQKVELRDFWADEARDFTPWLVKEDNIQQLSETIGIDIEIEKTEVYIGNYKADMLGRDISNNQKIIIENQLEKSNHDHLGKILTYASGIGASVIIWICSTITDEHRQAIDWLNENTNDDISFFALEIELWKINDSLPAPRFNIICSPNEWTKSTKDSINTSQLSDTKSLQLEFWNYLKDYFNQTSTFLSLRKPRAQHWYSLAIGRSKFNISLTVNTLSHRLGCELYMRGDSAKKSFSELIKDKEKIEKELGINLNWQELPEGQDCRIILYRDGDIKNKENWDEICQWFKKWTELFYNTFNERIKKIKI